MIAQFSLAPSGAKRLIAMGAAALPEVQKAMTEGKIIVAGGTTNAFVAEELGYGEIEEKSRYTAGIITDGVACITSFSDRLPPMCLEKGSRKDVSWDVFLGQFNANDVFIKGANAFDPQGLAGILITGAGGGTIGKAMGTLTAAGASLIIPVGHEKLIPSCREAARLMGMEKVNDSLGMASGYIVVAQGLIFTEVEAIEALFGLRAVVASAGGVGGMEGAVTMVVEGDAPMVEKMMACAERLSRERPLNGLKQPCGQCRTPCRRIKRK